MANWVRLWLVFALVAVLWALLGQTPDRQINVLAGITPGPPLQTITDTVRIMFGPDEKSIAYAMEIAKRESGPGLDQVVGDNGKSICEFQINMPSHPGWLREVLLTPAGCAVAAWDISEHGTDWSQWSTHQKGE